MPVDGFRVEEFHKDGGEEFTVDGEDVGKVAEDEVEDAHESDDLWEVGAFRDGLDNQGTQSLLQHGHIFGVLKKSISYGQYNVIS